MDDQPKNPQSDACDKRAYRSPRLVDRGSVRTLTRSIGGSGADGNANPSQRRTK